MGTKPTNSSEPSERIREKEQEKERAAEDRGTSQGAEDPKEDWDWLWHEWLRHAGIREIEWHPDKHPGNLTSLDMLKNVAAVYQWSLKTYNSSRDRGLEDWWSLDEENEEEKTRQRGKGKHDVSKSECDTLKSDNLRFLNIGAEDEEHESKWSSGSSRLRQKIAVDGQFFSREEAVSVSISPENFSASPPASKLRATGPAQEGFKGAGSGERLEIVERPRRRRLTPRSILFN